MYKLLWFIYLSLDLSDLKTSRQSVDELLGLLLVCNADGVQVAAAADLELGHTSRLLDGGGLDILAASELEELLDVGDFLLEGELVR